MLITLACIYYFLKIIQKLCELCNKFLELRAENKRKGLARMEESSESRIISQIYSETKWSISKLLLKIFVQWLAESASSSMRKSPASSPYSSCSLSKRLEVGELLQQFVYSFCDLRAADVEQFHLFLAILAYISQKIIAHWLRRVCIDTILQRLR